MRYLNRVSNLCKIGLKGYDFFFGDLTYLGLFFMQNLCKTKRVIFLEILRS